MTEPGLGPLPVVEDLDVVEECAAEACPAHVDQRSVDPAELTLEGRPEGLHGGVVVAVAGRPIGRDQAELSKMVGEVERGVLAALVAVVDEFGVWFTSGHGHGDGLDDQFAGLAVAHRPADEPPATEVSTPARKSLPSPVENSVMSATQRSLGRLAEKSRFKQIGGGSHVQPATAPLLTSVDPDQVFLGHEPGHPLAPDTGSQPAELTVDARSPIGAPRALVDLPDGVGQVGILETSRGGWLVGPGVVTAA